MSVTHPSSSSTGVLNPDGRAVVARGVHRSFGDRDVLHGLDVVADPGEFVALLGKSGSGKSTFLRIVAGLDLDYSGEVYVPQRRAVVFQEPRLLPWHRALANVTVGLRRTAHLPKNEVDRLGRVALGEVGLSDHVHSWPRTLSGGEAQRVALARALVRQPELLLLDEPFGALDALTRTKMHGLLQELCRRHRPAVVLVTHDVDEAILLADRVMVLTEGRISLDREVGLRRPRSRADTGFVALRSRLLSELGVDDQ
jgi:sulfonate transport system ATP-binding protein